MHKVHIKSLPLDIAGKWFVSSGTMAGVMVTSPLNDTCYRGEHGRGAWAVAREGKVQSVLQLQNPQIVLLLWEDKWDLSERLFI